MGPLTDACAGELKPEICSFAKVCCRNHQKSSESSESPEVIRSHPKSISWTYIPKHNLPSGTMFFPIAVAELGGHQAGQGEASWWHQNNRGLMATSRYSKMYPVGMVHISGYIWTYSEKLYDPTLALLIVMGYIGLWTFTVSNIDNPSISTDHSLRRPDLAWL